MNARLKRILMPIVSIPLMGYAVYLLLNLDVWNLPKPPFHVFRFISGTLLFTVGFVILFRWMEPFRWHKRYIQDDSSEQPIKLGSPILISILTALFLPPLLSFTGRFSFELIGVLNTLTVIGAIIPAIQLWYKYYAQQKKNRDAKSRVPISKLDKESVEKI
jgi:hypothetical protein